MRIASTRILALGLMLASSQASHLISAEAEESGIAWETDLQAAIAAAQSSDRPLLVVFS